MKTKAIYLIALAFLAGLALANNQQTATYDSLNVRVVWTFHGTREFGGLAMAPDTTLWTCYPGTHTLIKIDASDPEAIDTSFYEMDSLLGAVIDIFHDSVLIMYVGTFTDQAMLLLNINDDPPSVISRYDSPYLCFFIAGTAQPWIIVDDSILVTANRENPTRITLFDISNPADIDTYSTDNLVYTIASYFSCKDSFLFITRCTDASTEPPYSLRTRLSVVNIADPFNPVHDTILYSYHLHISSPEVPIPSVVADTFLFLAANYFEAPLADVYSIADPTAPRHLGAIGEYAWRYSKRVIDYQNGYLYSGMWIHDITGFPTNDSLVGYIDGMPSFLKVCGEYIYRITGASFVIYEFYEYDPNHVFVPEIKAPATQERFFLSPNPIYKYANIRLPEPLAGEIEIYNILGQRIAGKKVISSKMEYSFDLSDYSPGLYLVTFRSGDMRFSKKLIILE